MPSARCPVPDARYLIPLADFQTFPQLARKFYPENFEDYHDDSPAALQVLGISGV
jgi:hypothetical protein